MAKKLKCQWLNTINFLFKASRAEQGASREAQLVKNSPAMQETPVQFLGQEVPLEKGYPLQYSSLESSTDYSPWGRKESDTSERLSSAQRRAEESQGDIWKNQGAGVLLGPSSDQTQHWALIRTMAARTPGAKALF